MVLIQVLAALLLLFPAAHGRSVPFWQGAPIELKMKYTAARIDLANPANIKLNVVQDDFNTGDSVEVKWVIASTVPDPDIWLAQFLMIEQGARESNVLQFVPVKYVDIYCPKAGQCSGSFSFHMVNYRQDTFFAVMAGDPNKQPVALALSDVARINDPNSPQQGHLTFTENDSEVLVQWSTRDKLSPVVEWGLNPGEYTRTAAANSVTYVREEMCDAPANSLGWVPPGMLHRGPMSGLQPSTRYYYRYGSPEGGFSQEFTFVTPPAKTKPPQPVRILVMADVGQAAADDSITTFSKSTKPSLYTLAYVTEDILQAERAATAASPAESHAIVGRHTNFPHLPITLLFHNGDISYADGQLGVWDGFFQLLQPAATRVPYMVSLGNHESDSPHSDDRFGGKGTSSGGECSITTVRRQKLPVASESTYWYSFDHGPLHILVYSTEHDFSPTSPQYEFIQSDLAGVDREATPWVVVAGHRPAYALTREYGGVEDDQEVARDLRRDLEPLFLEHRVDMVWSGHTHAYYHTCPLAASECRGFDTQGRARAPVHVCFGMGGAEMQPVQETLSPVPGYFTRLLYSYGYMRVEADASVLRMYMVSDTYRDNVTKVELRKGEGKADWWWEEEGNRDVGAVQKAAVDEYNNIVGAIKNDLVVVS